MPQQRLIHQPLLLRPSCLLSHVDKWWLRANSPHIEAAGPQLPLSVGFKGGEELKKPSCVGLL
eukprot:3361698-Prorocentrum_lima.AAC.1